MSLKQWRNVLHVVMAKWRYPKFLAKLSNSDLCNKLREFLKTHHNVLNPKAKQNLKHDFFSRFALKMNCYTRIVIPRVTK